MSYSYHRQFEVDLDAISPGDVLMWWYDKWKKNKYHIFLTWEGDHIFLNTPKERRYPNDMAIHSDDLPFLKPTEVGWSAACCGLIMPMSQQAGLRGLNAKHVGNVDMRTLDRLLSHVENLKSTEAKVIDRISETRRALSGNSV